MALFRSLVKNISQNKNVQSRKKFIPIITKNIFLSIFIIQFIWKGERDDMYIVDICSIILYLGNVNEVYLADFPSF